MCAIFCQNCAKEIDPAAPACPSCGFPTGQALNSENTTAAGYLGYHVRIMGVLWIIYGILRLAAAVWLAGFNTTATLMFGALLARVPNPYVLMTFFHLLYLLIIVWCVICGVLGIVAGLLLLARSGAGRRVAILAAFLSIPEIPFGEALGAYTLVILLPSSARQLYSGLRSK